MCSDVYKIKEVFQLRKRKNLERTVILGLILSTGVYGSAWAESLTVSNILEDNDNTQWGQPLFGLNGDEYNVVGFDGYYNSEKTFDYISVDVKNNYYHWGGDAGDQAIGISTRQNAVDFLWKPDVILNSTGTINVNVQTRNAQNAYGLLADDNGRSINLISSNGNIKIDVSKAVGKKYWSAVDPGSINYQNAKVHGSQALNNGTVNLRAENGSIEVNAYYDTTNANVNETQKLQQGDIYAIGNSDGTVKLYAGNAISLTAIAHSGNAYGFDSFEGNALITAVVGQPSPITNRHAP